MDASAVARSPIARDDLLRPLAALVRIACAAMLALVALAGMVIWLRRVSGSLVAPLPMPGMLAAGASISLTALAFRRVCLPTTSNASHARDAWLALAVPSVVAVLSAAAISLPESTLPGLAALWILVIAEETSAWGAAISRSRVARRVRSVGAVQGMLSEAPHTVLAIASSDELEEAVASPLDDPATSQYFVRRREENGVERIEGWVRAEFAASQRHAAVHLAICPPLDHTPECYAELGEGPSGEVKVAQVLPWGVRLEIKLDEPTLEPTIALVEFSIIEGREHDL